jgi:Zn-dependent protease with chaperone function
MMGSFSLTGFVYIQGSSRRMDARLFGAEHGGETWVRIVTPDEKELACSLLQDLQIDATTGTTARKLTFLNGTVFETSDYSGFEQIEGNSRSARLHRLEQFGPHLFGFSIACLAGAYLLWRYGLDILATLAVALTPNIVVEQIDRGTLQSIDYLLAQPSGLDKGKQDDVRLIYERLIAALPEKERGSRDFALRFRQMPSVGPNAFALPGGTMVITDDLIRQFPDKDIIAGILGHEVGHVVEEHGLRRLYRSLGAYVLVALLAGETGPLMEDLLLEGNALLALSYSRKQEISADRFGLSLSYYAGFDPAGLKEFFEAISEKSDQEMQWMSSHPSHENRVKAIDTFIVTVPLQ